jgi:hypothetical protein
MFKGQMSYSAQLALYIQHGDGSVLVYFKGWSVQFKGSNDVYYVRQDNSNIYAYRSKERLSGCLPVNKSEERVKVYKALNAVGIFTVAWTEGNV